MTITTTRRSSRIARAALVLVAAVGLGACVPKPAAAPPPPTSVTCATPTTGSAATPSEWLEQCHLQYRSYRLDTTNTFAQATADRLAAVITESQCASSLSALHTPVATLLGQYPGSRSVGENLYCMWYSPPGCASAQFGANSAMNAWIASPTHKANLDAFAGKSVNAAAACVPGPGPSVYVAVAQFHNP